MIKVLMSILLAVVLLSLMFFATNCTVNGELNSPYALKARKVCYIVAIIFAFFGGVFIAS